MEHENWAIYRSKNPAWRHYRSGILDHATMTGHRVRVSVENKDVSEVDFTFSLFKTNAYLKHISVVFFFSLKLNDNINL